MTRKKYKRDTPATNTGHRPLHQHAYTLLKQLTQIFITLQLSLNNQLTYFNINNSNERKIITNDFTKVMLHTTLHETDKLCSK